MQLACNYLEYLCRLGRFEVDMVDETRRVTIGHWFRDKWPELIIMLILVPVCAVVFQINARLTGTEVQIIGNKERISRIVEALHSFRVRVALEDVSRPINYAVFVFKDIDQSVGRVGVNLFDPENGLMLVYAFPRKSGNWGVIPHAINGAISAGPADTVSFAHLNHAAIELEKPGISPAGVDLVNSLVSYSENIEEAKERLEYIGMELVDMHYFETGSSSWIHLSELLNSGRLKPVQTSSVEY